MEGKVYAGSYRTVRELSAEGTGRTWLAEGPEGRQVVVKVVRPRDSVEAALIEHEIDLASGIGDATLPTIIEWGHDGSDLFVVRDYFEGDDLLTELALQQRFVPLTVARYGSEAAEALARLHERRLAHGNVRTANLLRSPSDQLVLVGAGLGERDAPRALTADAPASAAWYLAPERIEGETAAASSDIYALGAVLYEMLTGRPPFEGESAAEVADKQLHASPRPVGDLAPEAPAALSAAIMRAMEKSPEARWQSAAEFAAALRAVGSPEAPIAVAPAKRSKTALVAVIAAVLVLALLGAAWAAGLFAGRTAVPDLAGRTVSEAQDAAAAAGLTVGAVTYSGEAGTGVADGLVSGQSPVAGTSVPPGTKIDLVLAGREMITVPNGVGKTESEARSLIEGVGLTVGLVTDVPTSTATTDTVTSQDPSAAAQAAKGSPVDLWVAVPQTEAAVPNVLGLAQGSAATALTGAGFGVAIVTLASPTAAEGVVIDQTPSAGVVALTGSAVTIRVSSGPGAVVVPKVIGMTQAEAVNALTFVGFRTQVALQKGGGTVGTVIAQSPLGGQDAASGTAVIITVVQ